MLDPRVTKLAELLCGHSTELTSDDTVLIHAFDIQPECVAEIVRVAQSTGAKVITRLETEEVRRQMLLGLTEETAKTWADIEAYEMDRMTAYIGLRGSHNTSTQSDVPEANTKMFQQLYATPVVFERRVNNTKWAVLRWPHPAMAQSASMSTQAFEKFYFDV